MAESFLENMGGSLKIQEGVQIIEDDGIRYDIIRHKDEINIKHVSFHFCSI